MKSVWISARIQRIKISATAAGVETVEEGSQACIARRLNDAFVALSVIRNAYTPEGRSMLLVFTLKRSSASVEGKRRGERKREGKKKKRRRNPFTSGGVVKYRAMGREWEDERVEQNNDTLVRRRRRRSLGESNLEK